MMSNIDSGYLKEEFKDHLWNRIRHEFLLEKRKLKEKILFNFFKFLQNLKKYTFS